jgi:23S rRNA pseudouridine1911/1915/1917 synthase
LVNSEPIELVVLRDANGARLDRFLANATGISRAELQRWIGHGRVTVDGVPRHASGKVREGERVVVRPEPGAPTEAQPDPSVSFEIVYADDEVVVIDKPAGLVVHPARGHASGTVVNGLLARGLFRVADFAEGEPGSEHARPGIVHRLDKGTAGVMVVARTPSAREALKAQFQTHSIDRAYEAVVVGEAKSCTIATLYGRHPRSRLKFTSRVDRGKSAVTHVRALALLDGATHVECTLETGRTHQIRVHMAETGHPVLGDPLYAPPPADPRVRAVASGLGHQALWAKRLGFRHPRSGALVTFESRQPKEFADLLQALAR